MSNKSISRDGAFCQNTSFRGPNLERMRAAFEDAFLAPRDDGRVGPTVIAYTVVIVAVLLLLAALCFWPLLG